MVVLVQRPAGGWFISALCISNNYPYKHRLRQIQRARTRLPFLFSKMFVFKTRYIPSAQILFTIAEIELRLCDLLNVF